jgi:hypothetical protein
VQGFLVFICGTLQSGIVRIRGLSLCIAVDHQRGRVAVCARSRESTSAGGICGIYSQVRKFSDGSFYRLSASERYTMNARSEGYRLFISLSSHPGPAPSTVIKVSTSSRLRSRSTPLSAYLKTPKRRAVIRGMMGRVSTALNLHSSAAGRVDRYVCTQIEGEACVDV